MLFRKRLLSTQNQPDRDLERVTVEGPGMERTFGEGRGSATADEVSAKSFMTAIRSLGITIGTLVMSEQVGDLMIGSNPVFLNLIKIETS